jgi:hypothetical protein
LLRRLHRRALLTRGDDGTHVAFHDLQHDFLRLNIASLVDAHEKCGCRSVIAYSAWCSFLRHRS